MDDWQGRREPGVPEARGRPRTQPGAGGPRPTQRDFGHGTLARPGYAGSSGPERQLSTSLDEKTGTPLCCGDIGLVHRR
jgi:hypothetical protein